MAIEILLVRLFEITTLITFFVLALTTGVFLLLLKSGLFILGFAFKPTVAIIVFAASRCLVLVAWTLQLSVLWIFGYGEKLLG